MAVCAAFRRKRQSIIRELRQSHKKGYNYWQLSIYTFLK